MADQVVRILSLLPVAVLVMFSFSIPGSQFVSHVVSVRNDPYDVRFCVDRTSHTINDGNKNYLVGLILQH